MEKQIDREHLASLMCHKTKQNKTKTYWMVKNVYLMRLMFSYKMKNGQTDKKLIRLTNRK